jgi:hypothetical protein
MDFIIKLLPSIKLIIKVIFDLILIITDRLTKYKYFILYCKGVDNNNNNKVEGWSLPYVVRQTPCVRVAGAPRAPCAAKMKEKKKRIVLISDWQTVLAT